MMTDLTPEKDGVINVDMEDDVIRGTTVIKEGKITWPPPPLAVSAAPAKKPAAEVVKPEPTKSSGMGFVSALVVAALGLWWMGSAAPADFMQLFTVFVLSCFIGYWVVGNVSAAPHTPLMSVTNAISSVIIIGALLQIGSTSSTIMILATISIFIASLNIGGGFFVTWRMLKMFRRED